ncbi:MAG: hypothetical protein ACSHW2_10755 [Parasphingopyxis sp.]
MFFKANRSTLYAIMGIALASTGSAALADVLVTRSSGTIAREIPRGSRLSDTQTLRLSAGDRVTVLTSNGTRQFNGPGRFRINGPVRVASGGVTTRGNNGTARTGVSRGADPIMRTPWQVNIIEGGPFCVVEGQPLELWRGNASIDAEVTVTRVADGESMTIRMAQGEYAQSWPAGLAVTGGTYTVAIQGSTAHAQMEFVPLSIDADDSVAVGQALLSNECDGQLDAMTVRPQVALTSGD